MAAQGGWPLGFLVSCQVTLLKSFEANFLSPHLVMNLRTEFRSGAQSSEQRQQPFHFTGPGWGVLSLPYDWGGSLPQLLCLIRFQILTHSLSPRYLLTTFVSFYTVHACTCVRACVCVFVHFVLFGCKASISSVYHVGQKQTLLGDNTAILILPVKQI